jgi:NADH-quinone oxidoreductase subunit E
MNPDHILDIVKKHTGRGRIITILEEIQKKYSYLPEEALRMVSEATGRPLVDIYGVATFYKLSA